MFHILLEYACIFENMQITFPHTRGRREGKPERRESFGGERQYKNKRTPLVLTCCGMVESPSGGPKMGKQIGMPPRIALLPSLTALVLQKRFSRPLALLYEMTVAPTAWICADAPDAVCVMVVKSPVMVVR